jgi:protein-tyrosine phosphatase
MAQSVIRKLAASVSFSDQLWVDSAGIHASHFSEKPDRRAELALSRRGYELAHTRSRRIEPQDFEKFDLLLAMDATNLTDLQRLAPPAYLNKVRLFLSFAEGLNETEVPDPYYGNAEGFERVLDLCEAGARGLIKHYTL